MGVHRRLATAERGAQGEDPVGRVEEVLAPDHVRDAHVDVVDRVGEEEDGRAVGAEDHEVVDQAPLDADLAADGVVERAGPVVGGSEPHDVGSSLGGERGARIRRRDRGSGRRNRAGVPAAFSASLRAFSSSAVQ